VDHQIRRERAKAAGAGEDLTVQAGQKAPLGAGEEFLPGWQDGNLLGVAFITIEAMGGSSGDGGAGGLGCKNAGAWTTNVKPQLSTATSTGGTCLGCHTGGGNGQGAFNLTGPDANACLSTLGEVDVSTPASPNLYKKVDPNSGVAHTGGKLSATALTNFENAVGTWIATEK
jgi:hypothetical protein